MRILSLLPSATEIVCALGARPDLVGISHECDHPPGLEGLPVLTRARHAPRATSGGIDEAVREVLRDALAVYEVDRDRLAAVAPDVVVTQDLCDVCAVSLDDVRAALADLARAEVEIVSLRPERLADVWEDVRRTGRAIGRAAEAERVVADLEARVDDVRRRAHDAPPPAGRGRGVDRPRDARGPVAPGDDRDRRGPQPGLGAR